MTNSNGYILASDPATGGLRSYAVDDSDFDEQLDRRTRPITIVAT